MNTWLVIACPGSRTDELAHCLGSLQHPPERTVIVTAASFDPLVGHFPQSEHCITVHGSFFSIGLLWNFGLQAAYGRGADHVAVLASDTVGHPGSLDLLASVMATEGWTMAGPAFDGSPTRHLEGPRTCHDRVQGAAFMLEARHGLLCDATYRWWYTEDDLEMQARQVGPVGLVAGTGLALSTVDTALTEERHAWAVAGRAWFVEKWGSQPW